MNAAAATPAILIVDDEIHIRLLLERCLKRTGAPLHIATRGDDAVQIVARGGIGLVILDYELPGMNGVEALRAIRAQPEGGRLPAIMLTARGRADFQSELAALDVAGFFAKPFSPAELARTAAALLQRGT